MFCCQATARSSFNIALHPQGQTNTIWHTLTAGPLVLSVSHCSQLSLPYCLCMNRNASCCLLAPTKKANVSFSDLYLLQA